MYYNEFIVYSELSLDRNSSAQSLSNMEKHCHHLWGFIINSHAKWTLGNIDTSRYFLSKQ